MVAAWEGVISILLVVSLVGDFLKLYWSLYSLVLFLNFLNSLILHANLSSLFLPSSHSPHLIGHCIFRTIFEGYLSVMFVSNFHEYLSTADL